MPCRLFVLFLLLILGLGTVRKKHNTDECFSLGQLFGTAWGKKNSYSTSLSHSTLDSSCLLREGVEDVECRAL